VDAVNETDLVRVVVQERVAVTKRFCTSERMASMVVCDGGPNTKCPSWQEFRVEGTDPALRDAAC